MCGSGSPTVFENLEAGLTVEEAMEAFAVTRVLHFAADSRKSSLA